MAAPAYSQHRPSHSPHPRGPAIPHHAPPGTFAPGTVITVGAHKCTIERYLSEGGFAHVYLVRLAKPVDGTDIAVLKRVAVPDKEALGNMRTEVDTMKRLKGHRHIVTYIDSHASHLKPAGYEVFLLMEYCSGGGLIDFMNTRLQHRLTEPEVLKIFCDVAEGVACMHYLQPPLLHRDLKVENVLISPNGQYKLCDFGSCSPVKPAPQSVVECRLLEEDIQKHTTLQYRSPEMIDVYRRLPVDEKSDIWALGVLLYKLCYYTTPFEEHGQLAILNATFSYPAYPPFSDRLKNLIGSMLREHPHERPNIYQVLRETCYMRGKQVPIPDIYSKPATSQSRTVAEKSRPPVPVQSPPSVISYQAPPPPEQPLIPDIVPMRRGRPSAASAAASASKPQSPATSQTRVSGRSPQVAPGSSDPFAVLDAKSPPIVTDELSNRFPSVEQFALLHDSGSKFQFSDGGRTPPTDSQQAFNEKVAEKLAERAFGTSPPKPSPAKPDLRATMDAKDIQRLSRGPTGSYDYQSPQYEAKPTRPVMVSTGTMTSPSPSSSPKLRHETPQSRELTATASSTTTERPSEAYVASKLMEQQLARPSLLDVGRSSTVVPTTRAVSSSRPSLESHRSPSAADLSDPVERSKSANSRPRPHSVYVESNLEFLRDLDSPSSATPSTADGLPPLSSLRIQHSGASLSSQQSEHIESNVEFLRAMQENSDGRSERRSVSGGFARHSKRASMPSITLPKPGPVKTKLGGKFGAAFHRFERGHGNSSAESSPISPDANYLMPGITDNLGASSDGGDEWEVSSHEIPPEVKRELEKRQLAQEERRVAAAAAEYKRQIAGREAGHDGLRQKSSRERATSIQTRVQNLLNENNSKEPPPRTAEGYGRYTAEPAQMQTPPPQQLTGTRAPKGGDAYRVQSQNTSSTARRDNTDVSSRPTTSTTPGPSRVTTLPRTTDSTLNPRSIGSSGLAADPLSSSPASSKITIPRKPVSSGQPPNPPPKPNKLRTGTSTTSSVPTRRRKDSDLIDLKDGNDGMTESPITMGGIEGAAGDDWEINFAKKYPSLTGLEMVETVIGNGSERKK